MLIVDDLEKWREELVETLQDEGFHADSAATAQQALELLNTMFYHILLLDIRLDESDPGNVDGLELLGELARRNLNEAVQVILLSAHDTKEQIRTAFTEHNVADSLSKANFDTLAKDQLTRQIFLQSIQRVLTKKTAINLALDIRWLQVKGPEQAVLNLEIGDIRLKRHSSLRDLVALELEDLLCRLFHQATSVLVKSLTPGRSGTGILWVQPFYTSGGGRAVIVKYGDFHKIETEHANFKQYVQPFIGGGRNTAVLDLRRTQRLSGITYSLLGSDDDQLEDFGNYYQHAGVPEIKEVLDKLFFDTCRAWYANAGKLEPHDLATDYQELFGLTVEKLDHALLELQRSVQGKQKLVFKSLDSSRTFTNPFQIVTGLPLVRSTYICVTHGDFNQHNIFVDSNKCSWLIDFQSTGKGHILRDIAQLDSVIRFFLLTSEEATLEERLCMEETLCKPERFSQVEQLATEHTTENQALLKTYATVVHLRTLARQLMILNPDDDMSEYYIALFYNALNTLRFYTLPSRQREHALLCASLLADRLAPRG